MKSSELQKIVADGFIKEYEKSHPKLLEAIKAAIDKGETPNRIVAYLGKVKQSGSDKAFTKTVIGAIASHYYNEKKGT